MKKNPVTALLSLLLLLVLLGAGCGSPGSTPAKEAVTVDTKQVQSQDEVLEVDLKVPVLTGLKDKDVEERINRDLEKKILDFKDGVGQDAQEYAAEMKKNGFEAHPCEAYVSYDVRYNQDDLLSLSLTYYQYTGGAHGMTEMETLNINTGTGEKLALKDFFKPGDDYQNIILEGVHKQMAADPDVYFPDAAEKLTAIPADQPFYIEDGHVVVYFGLYELAPYSSGIPEFKVPVSVMP